MKQQLWQLNSALLIIFLLLLLVNFLLLKQSAPIVRKSSMREQLFESGKKTGIENFDVIYNNDLFDTYRAPLEEVLPLPLAGSIPEPKIPPMLAMPEIKRPQLLAPLPLILKGILFSSDENTSVALLEDETGKESSYYLGEHIKDGLLIKIGRERITILRSNGQHETLSLKKEDLFENSEKKSLASIVQKTDEGITVNPHQFARLIPTLGALIDELSLATAYKNGQALGLEIGTSPLQNFLREMELTRGDIVVSFNGIPLTDEKNRMKAYTLAQSLKFGSNVTLGVLRNNNPIEITYKLAHLEEQAFPFGAPPALNNGKFTLSRQQQRAENIRMFDQAHKQDRKSTIEALQQQLFENMKKREQTMRIR